MKTFVIPLLAICLLVNADSRPQKLVTKIEEQVQYFREQVEKAEANPNPEIKQTCTGDTYSYNGACLPCIAFCATPCPSEIAAGQSPYYCTSCSSIQTSLQGFFAISKLIVNTEDSSGICVPCSTQECKSGCPESYLDNTDYCTECFVGDYLYKESESATVGNCESCDSGCATACPATRTTRDHYCAGCSTGYRFVDHDGDGLGYCRPCDNGCLDACPTTGTNDNYCSQCDSDHYLHLPSSTSTTGQCSLCDVNCQQSCPTNHTGSDNYCTSCNEGYYLELDSNELTGRCKKCNPHCATTCPASTPSSQSGDYCTECVANGGDLFELLLGASFSFSGDSDLVNYIDCSSVDCANAFDNVYSSCLSIEDGYPCPTANPNGQCCGALRAAVSNNCEDDNSDLTDSDDDLNSLDPCIVQAPSMEDYTNIRCADTASISGTTRITGDFAITDLGAAFRLAFALICARDLGIPIANFLVTSVTETSTKQASFDVNYAVLPTDDVPIANITANLVDPTFLTAEALTTQLAAEGVALMVTNLETDESSIQTVAGSTATSLVTGLALAVSVFVAVFGF